MINRRENTNHNQYDRNFAEINRRTTEQVQIQPSLAPSTPFDWSEFILPQFSYMSVSDLADIPHMRRRALRSNLPSSIVRQINYYFSEENLVKDPHLRSLMDNQGWVDVFLIAEFPRIRRMTDDIELILRSMRASTTVEVQGIKLRKRYGWERWIINRLGDMDHNTTESSGRPTSAVPFQIGRRR